MNLTQKSTILVSILLGALAPTACTITSTSAPASSSTSDAGSDSGPPPAAINGLVNAYTGGTEGDYLGQVITTSADGNTVIGGTPLEQDLESGQGSAYSFAQSGGAWATSSVQIFPSGGVDGFGSSVAASADGSTIAIAARDTTSEVFVFTKFGATWKQVAQLAPKITANSGFGAAIALSGDGKTLAVGAPQENNQKGNVYIYSSTNGAWTQSAWFSSNETTSAFATSVALSNDGTALAVGAVGGASVGDNGPAAGEACVFTFDGSAWGEDANLNQDGYVDVAISGDGLTVAASHDFAVDVFTNVGGNWSKPTSLAPSGGGSDPLSGGAMAMSSDGRRIVLGAPVHAETPSGGGYIFVFDLGYGSWSESGSFTSPSGAVNGGEQFGQSVAISGDGSLIEVGSPNEMSQKGALYIFQ